MGTAACADGAGTLSSAVVENSTRSWRKRTRKVDPTTPRPTADCGCGWQAWAVNLEAKLEVLVGEVDALKRQGVHFRNRIVTGPGGKEILLDDPSGNPVELFQPA